MNQNKFDYIHEMLDKIKKFNQKDEKCILQSTGNNYACSKNNCNENSMITNEVIKQIVELIKANKFEEFNLQLEMRLSL